MIKRSTQPDPKVMDSQQIERDKPSGAHFYEAGEYYRQVSKTLYRWSRPLQEWVLVLHSKPKQGYVLDHSVELTITPYNLKSIV